MVPNEWDAILFEIPWILTKNLLYILAFTTPNPEKLGRFVKYHKIKNMLIAHSL